MDSLSRADQLIDESDECVGMPGAKHYFGTRWPANTPLTGDDGQLPNEIKAESTGDFRKGKLI
jgi:hypothetical protein